MKNGNEMIIKEKKAFAKATYMPSASFPGCAKKKFFLDQFCRFGRGGVKLTPGCHISKTKPHPLTIYM